MKRHELSDQQWALIAPFFPANGKPGGPWKDHRTVVNGILWRLNTGAPWRDLPDRYGKWKTLHDRLTKMRAGGLLDRLLAELPLRLDEGGLIDWDLWCVDGTSIRGSRAAAGASKKKSPASRPTTRSGGRAAGSARNATW
jgi:transposase